MRVSQKQKLKWVAGLTMADVKLFMYNKVLTFHQGSVTANYVNQRFSL